MRVQGDLKCYACGHVCASVEGEHRRPLTEAMITWHQPAGAAAPGRAGGLRCRRCGGALYLDDLRPIQRAIGTCSAGSGSGRRSA